jgi:hypothetical protein
MDIFRNITHDKKIAVWGWWQGRNLGDMWILESIKKKFPGIIPITTEIEDYSDYDFLLIGGGGLLNGPKLRAPFNKILPTKYGSFGLGGEFPIVDDFLSVFINNAEFFGVRDKRNIDTYKTNITTKLEMSCDCTFLYPLNKKFVNPNINIKNIKLIWRDPYGLLKWDKSKHHHLDGLELNMLFGNYLGVIPHNDNAKCLSLYKNLLGRHGNVLYETYNVNNFTYDDLYKRFKQIDLIVTMRYHGVMAAIQLGIPCIALDIYPKVRTLMQECDLEKYCIKLREFSKINNIIIDIKQNWNVIRKKMEVFTMSQSKIANRFADKAKSIIINTLNN